MIDTHSHLYYPEFADDLGDVISRARAAGVDRIITVAVDRATGEQCLAIAERFPGVVYAALGVHPSEIGSVTEDDLLWIEAAVGDPLVVAVGEIGLDVYRGETNLAQQERLFERMLHLARRVGLPAIVHHRAAGTRTLDIARHSGVAHGVFHCFSEDAAYAKQVIDMGWYVSFTGNITYKNSRLPDVARALPLDRIVLETDAPFMAPVPYRGKRCEPMHVCEVARSLAPLHQTTIENVARVTTLAAETLFFGRQSAIG